MELTIPFAELVTTCRRSCGNLATTSPSHRDVCCQGKKMAARPRPISNKNVTLAINLANQLERTKCMAGNRSPSCLVGCKRIIRRDGDSCVMILNVRFVRIAVPFDHRIDRGSVDHMSIG